MKTPNLAKILANLVGGASILLAANASAVDHTVTVTSSEAASFSVSNADLLQTAFSSYNGSALDDRTGSAPDTTYLQGLTPSGEASLRDGVWYDNPGNGRGSAMAENDEFAEFALDLTASPGGYTINGVDLYTNWGTGQGRDEIRVNVSFSLVGSPTVFDQILVVGGNPLFVYNPPTQTQGKVSLSGFSIPGVAAIRFDWPSTQESNAVAYSELDVFGVAAVDTDPPVLSSSNPANGATQVPTITDLTLTFNEDVQAGTGLIDLRTVTPDASVETFDVTGLPPGSFDGKDLTISPSSSLTSGVEYQLVVPSGAVEDLAGNPFDGIPVSTFTFTTDDVPPNLNLSGETLINAVPTNDLTIRFDENIQLANGQITIHLANGDLVQAIEVDGGAVTVNGNTATIDIADLDFGTGYYVNITAGTFTDLSGNALAAVTDDTTIAFTTTASLFIHHWEFESDPPLDSIGTHDGAFAGSASLTTGLIGQAVMFSGGADTVAVNQASFPATDFTFACWVKRDITGGTNVIAGTRASDLAGAYLALQGGSNTPVLTLRTNGSAVTLTATEGVPVGEWTHLAFTVDGTNGAVIYVNGIPAGSEPAATGHTVLDNFRFGRRPDVVGTDVYEGLIDDARIYAEVLPQSAIETLAGTPGPLVLKISQSGGNLDFEWNSMDGMQYDLLTSTDLSTPISSWPVYDDGVNPPYEDIPSTGIATTLSGVVKVGPVRFFAMREEPLPAP